jgi:hypothetical protein
MSTAVVIGLIVGILFFAASIYVIRRSYNRERGGRPLHNDQRPGQPEPGESDPANTGRPPHA